MKCSASGESCRVKRFLKNSCAEQNVTDSSLKRIPMTYAVLTDDQTQNEQYQGLGHRFSGTDCTLYFPPAVASAEGLTVLKFYALRKEVAIAMLHALHETVQVSPEFPFIPDQWEDDLINLDLLERKQSILLVGRSGTGKTSIAVARMWALYKQGQSQALLDSNVDMLEQKKQYRQVFVTANRVLRDQVRKSFFSMMQDSTTGRKPLALYPPSFAAVPDESFPLFLTQSEWLLMLDATLTEPFFPRNLDGSLVHRLQGGLHEEAGMLDSLDDLFEEEELLQVLFDHCDETNAVGERCL